MWGASLGLVGVLVAVWMWTRHRAAAAGWRRAEAELWAEVDRYRRVTEALPQIVWTTTPDGTLTYLNDRWAEFTGVPATGDRRAAIHPDDRSRVAAGWVEARQVGRPFEVEFRLRPAGGGAYHWFLARAVPVRGPDGEVVEWAGTSTDIEDLKQAAAELRASEARFHSTLDTLLEGCQLIGPDWRYLYVNAAVVRQSHRTRAELLGRTMPEVYPGIEATPLFTVLQECMTDRVPHRMKNHFDFGDGTSGWFDLSIQPVPEGVFILSVDITDRVAAEAELQADAGRFAALLKLQAEVTAAGLDRAGVLAAACRHALTITGATGSVVEEVDGDELVYRAAAGDVTPHLGLRIPREGSISGLCIQAGEPQVCDDSETDPRVDREACRRVGCRSLAVVPLIRRGRVEGVLKVTADQPAAFGPATVPALRLAAAATAAGLSGAAEAAAETRLHAADRRLAELVEGMSEGCFMLDADWRFTFVNDRCGPLLHRTREQMLGHTAWEVFDRLAGTPMEGQFRTAMADRTPLTFVAYSPTAERWLDVRVFPTGDGLAAFLLDIHDRKLAEEEVRRLNAELEERVRERTAELEAANRELEAFTYSVSHDLRAPLRAVDGFSRILVRDHVADLPDKAQGLLADVRAAAARMGRLIDDLLAFSRLGRRPLKRRPTDVAELVRQCRDELAALAAGRAVDWRVGDLPPADADPALLKQVWMNLLGNALKYTGRREYAVIEVGAASDSADTTYFVRDNGAGFDMQYADKLFGVFQRLHGADEFEGTGVGLAVVQRIVQRHGGRVWAEAVSGKGATFFFTAPNPCQVGATGSDGIVVSPE